MDNANNVFEGTFLGEIETLQAGGNFNQEVLPPPENDEEVIGECTDLEKAIFSLIGDKAGEVDKICNNCDDTLEDRTSPKCARAQQLKNQAKILNALLWRLIEDRLEKHESNLGIRQGYQIVEIHRSEIEVGNGLPPQLLAMLLGR